MTAVRRPLLAILVIAAPVAWYLGHLSPLTLGLSLTLVVLALKQLVVFKTSRREQSFLCWLFRSAPPWMGFRIEGLWLLELVNRAIRRFFHLSTDPLGATRTLRRHYELRWAAAQRYGCSTLCVHIYRETEERVSDYIRRGGSRDPGDIFELVSLMGRELVPLDSSEVADLILQSPDLLDVTLFGGEIEALRDYEEIIDLFPDKQLSIGNLVRVEFIQQLADSMAELFADAEDEGEPRCSECGVLLEPLDLVSDESR